MTEFVYQPIGTVRSPFKDIEGTPIQPAGAKAVKGQVVVKEAFAEGLKDLEGFSHICLLYAFHLSAGYRLTVKPFLDSELRGVFATRSPRRPNPIGLSVVKLIGREETILHIQGIDMVDGTPVLDIKPYIPPLDARDEVRVGWLEGKLDEFKTATADRRFHPKQP